MRAARLTGAARTAALQMSEAELCPFPAGVDNGKSEVWTDMNKAGVQRLLERLWRDLLQSKPIQRGERLSAFFSTTT